MVIVVNISGYHGNINHVNNDETKILWTVLLNISLLITYVVRPTYQIIIYNVVCVVQ
jgi:hypothetical protein